MFRSSLVLLAAVACWSAPLRAQSEPELTVGISEVCTVCNDVIRCERDADVDGPRVVVYNLLEDTIWQQIATIWDYLVQLISPITEDERAMTIYELATADTVAPRVIPDQQAIVDATTLSIRLPGGTEIDQKTGRWSRKVPAGEEQALGQCTLLNFADGRELLEKISPPGDGEAT